MKIERFGGTLGAVVHDIDLRDLDDATFAALHEAWLEHLILVFPGQHLDPASHAAFARRFGELELHPYTEKLDEAHPEVTLLHSDRGGRADVWHSDVPFSATPPKAAILRFLSGPQSGGDTMWANQHAAYETMSAPMQALLEPLTALNSAWSQGRPEAVSEHPVVRVHPETGRRSLYVNKLFTTAIPQLHPDESASLLAHLYAWSSQPELTCRWRWSDGDVAMWDNRCTMHYAIGDYSTERVMQRVTVIGDAPRGTGEPGPHFGALPLSAASALRRRAGGR
jgi:taurine dioxygenase